MLHESNLILVVPRIVQVFYVLFRKEHFAFFRVIEALNKRYDGRFSTARLSYQSDNLVLFNVEGDTFEDCNIGFGRIAELNTIKVNMDLFFSATLDLNLLMLSSWS